MILGKLLHPFWPQFPYLKVKMLMSMHLMGLCWRFSTIYACKHWVPCLTHNKCSIESSNFCYCLLIVILKLLWGYVQIYYFPGTNIPFSLALQMNIWMRTFCFYSPGLLVRSFQRVTLKVTVASYFILNSNVFKNKHSCSDCV